MTDQRPSDSSSEVHDTPMTRPELLAGQIKRVDGCLPSPMSTKHIKMATSPYAFYRGTAQLFYADLQAGNIAVPEQLFGLPQTSVIGDCHLSNFGFMTEEGSHGDTVIFAPNDFDDACVGYAHWDLLRFMTSLELAGRFARGVVDGTYTHEKNGTAKPAVSHADTEVAMHAFLRSYAQTCSKLLSDPGHRHYAVESVPPRSRIRKHFDKACRRAAGGDEFVTKSALAKAVYMRDTGLSFIRKTDKFTHLATHYYAELEHAFAPYMDDSVIDIVQRNNAGTGSVNLNRFYFLVGPARPHNEDSFARCHIVEVKQQREAAPLFYFPDISPINRLNPAHLTARCQRKMQRKADLLLDEAYWQKRHYLIRSRHHARVGIDPEDVTLGNKSVNGGFEEYAQLCGQVLALAHARGDRRSQVFEQQASAILPQHAQALSHAARQYADQVEQDFTWFVKALAGETKAN